MFRIGLFGLALATSLVAGPSRVVGLESVEEGSPPPAVAPARGGGADVSVDIEGSSSGLDERVFRSRLSAHGEWYPSERYGSVWRPHVAVGWRPYYYGAWLWTDEGWYWDSDEPFAWAVYHYGRWVYDPAWGWVWVPGYQWAPAWVAWRYGGDVVGWAPLGPGISVYVTSYPFIDYWWTFVPTTRFVGVPVHTVAYGPRETHRWFGATRPAPPRTAAPGRDVAAAPGPAWGGPARRLIEERVGRPISPARRSLTPALPGRVERERPPAVHGADRGAPERAPAWGPGGRVERERAPAAVPGPGRGERREVERPGLRPPPRGEQDRPPAAAPRRGGGGGEGARPRGWRDR